MKTLYKTSIEARDLPKAWQEAGALAPDQRVTVTVEAEDPDVTALRQGLDEAAAELDRGEGHDLADIDFEDIKRRGRERLARRS